MMHNYMSTLLHSASTRNVTSKYIIFKNMFAITLLLGIASTTGFSFGSRVGSSVNVHGDTTALKMVSEVTIVASSLSTSRHHQFLSVFTVSNYFDHTTKFATASALSYLQAVALAPLPYDTKALEPIIGEQTLLIHHGKHHAK